LRPGANIEHIQRLGEDVAGVRRHIHPASEPAVDEDGTGSTRLEQ
jgi:hypothetical protein